MGPVRSRDIGIAPTSGEVWLPVRATKIIYWESTACVLSCAVRVPVIILLLIEPDNSELAAAIIATVTAFITLIILWILDRRKLQAPEVAASNMSASLMEFVGTDENSHGD